VEQLVLDTENPRLAWRANGDSQDDLIEKYSPCKDDGTTHWA
jgi:hypothetical protein